MKILFLGAFDNSEIVLAPLKVANKLFAEIEKFETIEIKYFTYFYDETRRQKLFGKEKIKRNIFRFGIFSLLTNIIKYKPDIIQIVNPDAFYLPLYFLKPFIASKIIYHSHSLLPLMLKYYLDDNTKYERIRFKIICAFVYRRSDYIFLFSERERRYLRRYLNINEKKILVVNNGVENNDLKKNYFNDEETIRLIFVGGINKKEKGFDYLISALKVLGRKFILSIADYTNKENYAAIPENIELNRLDPMNENDLRQEIIKNDLIIVPSKYDSFNLALLEAMNSGLLFVSTNRVGLTIRMKNNYDELIVSYGRPDELAKKIENILNYSNDKKQRLSKEIHEFSLNFLWEKTAKDYSNIYKKILAINE